MLTTAANYIYLSYNRILGRTVVYFPRYILKYNTFCIWSFILRMIKCAVDSTIFFRFSLCPADGGSQRPLADVSLLRNATLLSRFCITGVYPSLPCPRLRFFSCQLAYTSNCFVALINFLLFSKLCRFSCNIFLARKTHPGLTNACID